MMPLSFDILDAKIAIFFFLLLFFISSLPLGKKFGLIASLFSGIPALIYSSFVNSVSDMNLLIFFNNFLFLFIIFDKKKFLFLSL